MAITMGQLRAARGLIGWSQQQLADAANVGRATITDFESGKREPYSRTVERLQRTLESAGVIFVAENGEGPGVRLRKAAPIPAATTAIDRQIAALETDLATIPATGERSPEAALHTMDRALAENELAALKGQRKRMKKGK